MKRPPVRGHRHDAVGVGLSLVHPAQQETARRVLAASGDRRRRAWQDGSQPRSAGSCQRRHQRTQRGQPARGQWDRAAQAGRAPVIEQKRVIVAEVTLVVEPGLTPGPARRRPRHQQTGRHNDRQRDEPPTVTNHDALLSYSAGRSARRRFSDLGLTLPFLVSRVHHQVGSPETERGRVDDHIEPQWVVPVDSEVLLVVSLPPGVAGRDDGVGGLLVHPAGLADTPDALARGGDQLDVQYRGIVPEELRAAPTQKDRVALAAQLGHHPSQGFKALADRRRSGRSRQPQQHRRPGAELPGPRTSCPGAWQARDSGPARATRSDWSR